MSHGHGHDPHLAHHFETKQQQFEAAKIGMWLFLATEILFFGGLFCAYAVYRANHPEIFLYGHQFLDKYMGGINTVVLLISSFTMAWGVRAAQIGNKKQLVTLLAITILCAFGFLGIKYVEYKSKWEHGLLWARSYNPQHEAATGHGSAADSGTARAHAASTSGAATADTAAARVDSAALAASSASATASATASAAGAERTALPTPRRGPPGLAAVVMDNAHHGERSEPENAQIFFSIYFAMTGLHGIHVLVGIGLLLWLLVRASRGEFGPGYYTPVDLVGLYWHLVDLIWIYLFPLLYLIH